MTAVLTKASRGIVLQTTIYVRKEDEEEDEGGYDETTKEAFVKEELPPNAQ